MDCSFSQRWRLSAVLLGAKQVRAQRSLFGDPRSQTGRGLTLTFSSTIQRLRGLGWSLRQIAEEVNCSASIVLYELRRGTPPRTGSRGRAPATLQSTDKRCMRQTEAAATSLPRRIAALAA